jgi:colicin import membrane protein
VPPSVLIGRNISPREGAIKVMSEQKESSVLFSLKELMGLEEDRIKSEEAETAAKAASEEQARRDTERAAREAEEARIRAEAERRRLEEQRAREEQARLEAMRVAEIERARVEAEQRARIEAMTVQQQHEKAMAALQNDEHKKSLRNRLIGAIVVGVLLVGAAGGVGFKVYSDAEIKRQQHEAESARLKQEQEKLTAQAKEQADKIDSLLKQLGDAKDDSEKARIKAQLADAQAAQQATKKGFVGGGAGAGAGAGPKPAGGGSGKKCTPGDPMCSEF